MKRELIFAKRILFGAAMLLFALCMFFGISAVGGTARAEEGAVAYADGVNALREADGEFALAPNAKTITYGKETSLLSYRPEYGDAVIWTVAGDGTQTSFAVTFTASGAQILFDVTGTGSDLAVDYAKPLPTSFGEQIAWLDAGSYTLTALVPAGTASAGSAHWWAAGETEEADIAYPAYTAELALTVKPYDISEENTSSPLMTAEVPGAHVFTGSPVVLTPSDIYLALRGKALSEADYEIISHNNNVDATKDRANKAWIVVRGHGNYTGNRRIPFEIDPATNTWEKIPQILGWTYGRFDAQLNRIYGSPVFGKDALTFKIATDLKGTPASSALAEIRLTVNGTVSTETAQALNALGRGAYYLFASVPSDENGNYTPLNPAGIRFEILPQHNNWVSRVSIGSWVWGSYSSGAITVNASALAGTVEFSLGYYDGEELVAQPFGEENEVWFTLTDGKLPAAADEWLQNCPAGKYRLEARVLGDSAGNYAELTDGVDFEIYPLQNHWVSEPFIGSWVWKEFPKDTFSVSAVPFRGEVVFEITYTEGETEQKVLFGEESKFTSLDGEKLEVLSSLPAGEYRLSAVVSGDATGSYNPISAEIPFSVHPATNEWVNTPEVIAWTFGSYYRNTNLILGASRFGTVSFTVTDENGTQVVPAFTLDENGLVGEGVATKFASLVRGSYTLTASVAGDGNNYAPLNSNIKFAVGQAINSWIVTPSIASWTEGKFDRNHAPIAYEAKFGNGGARVLITAADDPEKVIYDSENGIDLMETAEHGIYTLTVTVEGTNDYSALNEPVNFRIFEKAGLPWWAIVLIVVGALGVAAIVLFILHETGVLQMLTGKVVLAMRMRATIDATVAAIRANKTAERARQTVAAARAREGLEAARAAKKTKMTEEERLAALQERAKANAEKSERLRLKAEKIERQAKRILEKSGNAAEAQEEEGETSEAQEFAEAEELDERDVTFAPEEPHESSETGEEAAESAETASEDDEANSETNGDSADENE